VLGNVRRGDRVLIHGAAGGVGLAAVQLCRIYGGEIIGTASTAKHAALRAAGVAHTIDYRTQDFVAETKRVTGGKGADVILDPIGGENLRQSYRALAPLGRLVAYGVSSFAPGTSRRLLPALWQLARMPRFGFVRLMNENHGVLGFNLGHLWDEMDRLRAYLLKVLDYYRDGQVRPPVAKSFPLADAAGAHAFIQARANVGKVLLIP
jgi:NADPH:quinone reductase-like Zn-dependent oxidoreductase